MPGGDLKINGRGPKLDARLATSWLRASGHLGARLPLGEVALSRLWARLPRADLRQGRARLSWSVFEGEAVCGQIVRKAGRRARTRLDRTAASQSELERGRSSERAGPQARSPRSGSGRGKVSLEWGLGEIVCGRSSRGRRASGCTQRYTGSIFGRQGIRRDFLGERCPRGGHCVRETVRAPERCLPLGRTTRARPAERGRGDHSTGSSFGLP